MISPTDNLLPHQVALVEEYRSGSAPQVVRLDAPVGAGKSRALAVIAAERGLAGALVVVVVPNTLLVNQMILQLSEAGAPPAVYTTPAEFRLALGKNRALWPDSGVLVCTASVIRSPLATNALKNTSPPSLLIVDDVTATGYSDLGRALQALATRAHQIIFTDKRAEALFPPAEVRTWTFPLIDSEGQLIAPEFSVLVHEYPGDPAEAELVREAIQFLRKVPYLIPSHLFTRTAIQSELLKYARSLEKPEQLSLQEAEDEEPEATQIDFQPSDRPTIDTVLGDT